MRIALVVLVFVAACKKNPCEQAGDHMFGAISKHTAAWLSLTPEEMDTAKASLVEDCKMRPWDEGASACVGRAIDAKDLEACAAMENVGSWHVLVMEQVDPNGEKRYPEIDALIAELVAADKAVGTTPGECKGALPVVAIDRAVVQSLVAKKPLPEKTDIVGTWFLGALSPYALKQVVNVHQVTELRKWIKELPKDRVWAIVETDLRRVPESKGPKTFNEGLFLGTIHVVDGAKQTTLCQREVHAHSSESVKTYFIKDRAVLGIDEQLQSDFHTNVNKALDERLAKLRAGTPDVGASIAPFNTDLVVPGAKWMCTQNLQTPDVSICATDKKWCEKIRGGRDDEYAECLPASEVVCISYDDLRANEAKLSCQTTMAGCTIARRVLLAGGNVDKVSRCRPI